MNYIIWNGSNSTTIEGLIIQELPPITRPAIRAQITEIEGKDGDISDDLGYQSYDKAVKIGL
jgi:phage-related protein